MSLADACLERLVELHPGATVDSDFKIYRARGRQRIKLPAPGAERRPR
jgi:hypothetical protein